MPGPRDAFYDVLHDAAESGRQAFGQGYNAQAQSDLAKQEANQRLAQLIKGRQLDLDTLQKMKDSGLVESGGSAKVGDISTGSDPYAHMMGKQAQGGANAISQAQKQYMAGLPKIQSTVQAASEGLQAVNDPKQVGSLGQARTLMLKSMGMNRYNEDEAKAVLPPTLYSQVSGMFNKNFGEDSNPLSDVQKNAINQFFMNQIGHAKQQHDLLKANVEQGYSMSPYYDPSRGSQMHDTLGKPFGDQVTQLQSQYKAVPTTNAPPTPAPAKATHWYDPLAKLLGSPSAQAPASSAAHSGGASPMSFEDWKKANGR